MKNYEIKSGEDIQFFLEKTNSLHDAYLIGVQYVNDAITNVDEDGYLVNPENTKLVLKFLVTSIWNTVVELEFEAIREWQVRDNSWDLQDTSVRFEGDDILWLDDVYTNRENMKQGSYVLAGSMKWRIAE